jgi:AcrR family transcriptional regulator
MKSTKLSDSKADPYVVSEGAQLILDTAARLFRDEGYASTSLRDIAAECGMKAASLYHHFSSKDEIVSEVLRIGVERVFEEVRRSVMRLPPDVDARQLLRTAIHAHLSALLRLHDYTSANVRIFGQVPGHVREGHLALRDGYEKYWSSLLKRCAAGGRFQEGRDLHLARLFLLSGLNGSLDWFREGRMALRTVSYELADLLLDGLGARAESVQRKASR